MGRRGSTWGNSGACGPAGVGSLVSWRRRSVITGAYRRQVVRYVLALLVLSQAAGCGDDPSPTAPTPTQVAGNRAPSVSGAIPAQTLAVDGAAAAMDVALYFVDPDGDTLMYTAVSSDAAVATASVSGSTMTLTPVSLGTAIATVTATDPGGLTATQPVTVAVGQDDVPTPSGPQANPDLVVASSSVSDRRPAAGTTLTLSATVHNDGDGNSAATTVRFYQSADATVTTSDAQVGTDTVAALAASGRASASVDLTTPAAGTYYYGACVDAVTGESDTTNNCSTSVQVDVPEPAALTRPDVVVASAAVSNSGPAVGAPFTLSATVRNDGDGTSAAATVRFYRSADATVTTSDAQVGTDTVAALAASGRASASADLTAPAAGTYYYGACVDAVTGESDTTNNCSAAVEVTVLESTAQQQGAPDLVVASPSVSDSRPAVGTPFTLSATVRNDGEGESQATTLRYYRSADSTITASDAAVGTNAVAALGASGSGSESVALTAPSAAGRYYYGACVDAVASESDTTNNCSSSVQVDVREPPPPSHPDLVLASPTVSESGPAAGASFALSTTVRNEGDGDAAATTLRYYRSSDSTITTSDTQVGTDAVGTLAASDSGSQSVNLNAPSSAGRYYYGACVDAVAGESDTTNNCSASVQIDVPEPPPVTTPDLVVASPSVSDSGPAAGAAFTLSATVRNDGDGDAAATTLRYYRSTDATITTSDTEVGTDAVAALVASGTSAESIDATAPATAGRYYYGACVEAVTGESDTTNNCSASVQVDVPDPLPSSSPDLVVASPSVSDNSPETGASFTLSATVSNTGDGQAAATTLRYYRSTDATISTSDAQEDTDAVEGLAASGTSSESTVLTAPSTPGTYYYGACVDTVTGESDATNNCSTSVSVVVPESTLQGGPDLVLSGLDGSANGDRNGAVSQSGLIIVVSDINIHPGDTFGMGVSVQNSGDAPAGATTMRFYQSSDSTISTSDTQVGTDEVTALGVSQRVSGGTEVTAPSPGTYYYGACVDAVPGETDTTNNCIGALRLDVVDPNLPDLILPPPSVSDRFVSAGETFTLTAHVRNFGTTSQATSQATTLRYYQSTDSSISTSDTEVGTDAIPALPAYGISTQSVDLTAPSLSGTYYYGACVDAVANEVDTTNNCSYDTSIVVR